jgi:hypothetical protein
VSIDLPFDQHGRSSRHAQLSELGPTVRVVADGEERSDSVRLALDVAVALYPDPRCPGARRGPLLHAARGHPGRRRNGSSWPPR